MTTFTEKVEEIVEEYCEPFIENGLIKGMVLSGSAIKAIAEAHQAEISRVLERVEKEVIGDDEEDDLNPFGMVARPMAENGLRFKQRQAINKIKGELR